MSRMFRYIQNEDVVKSFLELKDSVLKERPVVIARHGDYSLFLKRISEKELGITIENTVKHNVCQDRSYNVEQTPNEIVARGVRHACQKMAELCDADVNRRRLQIWKWYIMDWQQTVGKDAKTLMEEELTWNDDNTNVEKEVMDIEAYLHGDYLNMGHTLGLIEKYLSKDKEHLEAFRSFAIADIMEMTGEDTKDRSLAFAEEQRAKEGMKKHTYQFVVSVEATDKEHARQALLSYLAGDDRISIQK